jgi:hypothetical protein
VKAVIVGHGPGLWEKGRGELIDSFDAVIRIYDFLWQDQKNYGSKVDYCMYTYTAARMIPALKNPPESWTKTRSMESISPKEIWIVHHMGSFGALMVGPGADKLEDDYREYNPKIFNNLVYYWNYNYQQYRPKYQKFSTGILTVMVAAYHLKPEELCLIGFDNLKAGINEEYWAGYRGENGNGAIHKCLMNHDLAAESSLVFDIANAYQVEIKYI